MSSINAITKGAPQFPFYMDVAEFGQRFLNSKYSRPYRYKSRKAMTNYRSGNKKKLRQYVH